jgi:hypothetical protein
MADKLTAAEISDYSERNLRLLVTRTMTIDNDAISQTDISDRVKDWGDLKTTVYNKHPKDPGQIVFPTMTLEADNSDGYFDPGGAIFPNGSSDFGSTTAIVTIAIGSRTILEFTGAVLEPEIDSTEIFNILMEHPLTKINARRWSREDRYGGDTGINGSFV